MTDEEIPKVMMKVIYSLGRDGQTEEMEGEFVLPRSPDISLGISIRNGDTIHSFFPRNIIKLEITGLPDKYWMGWDEMKGELELFYKTLEQRQQAGEISTRPPGSQFG